jgi:hypothetical protein
MCFFLGDGGSIAYSNVHDALNSEVRMRIRRTYYRSAGWVPCGGTHPPRFESSTWHGCSHFPEFIPGFTSAILSVIDDVPVDSETSDRPAQSFSDAHRGRICVRVFIGVSVRACVVVYVVLCKSQKKTRDMHVLKKHLRILIENSVGHSTYASWVKYTSYRQLLISKV